MEHTQDKPCPLCDSRDISRNMWSLERGEVDALECNKCYCGAPKAVWNSKRTTKESNK